MAMPQRDDTIEAKKRLDALLEYAVVHNDKAEAAREKFIRSANRFVSRLEDVDFCSAASAPTFSPFSPCGGR